MKDPTGLKMLKRLGGNRMRFFFPETITHKIFETNSSFHVKKGTTGKASFQFSKSIPLLLGKLSFGGETGN